MALQLLHDKTIANANPADKDKRLNDGGGLYILIKPNSSKWWRFDYTHASKRKTLSVGVYPATTLQTAREKAVAARKTLAMTAKKPKQLNC